MSTTPTLNAVVEADALAGPEPVVGAEGAMVDGVEPPFGLPVEPLAGLFDEPFEALPLELLPFDGVVDGTRRLGVGNTVVGGVDDGLPLSWFVRA
jgi:hypothetical protein